MSAAKVFKKDEKNSYNFLKCVVTPTFYVMDWKWQAYSLVSVSEEKLFVLYFDYTKKRPKKRCCDDFVIKNVQKVACMLPFVM